jgi:D-glycero-D-manno-heptose 1,7-bisphosphate phosphatase
MMVPAIFLDRDGVIIENCPEYVRVWEDVQIFEQALAALRSLYSSTYKIVIVTNQSAIGRGIITFEQAHSINTRLIETIMHTGGRIDGVFMCPHTPDDQCQCRKPNPGMLLQAAKELSIDLSRSIMIGDALSDLLAGKRAEVPQLSLVRTGRGMLQSQLSVPDELGSFLIYDNLSNAIYNLIKT